MNRISKTGVMITALLLMGGGCVSIKVDGEPIGSSSSQREEVRVVDEEVVGSLVVEEQALAPIGESSASMIYSHAVYFASSADEQSWYVRKEPIALHASVPDLLTIETAVGDIPAGALVSYFVDAAPTAYGEDETISFMYSLDDGVTWTERSQIEFDQEILGVDPSVVQLEDGRLRLYVFDFTLSKDLSVKDRSYLFYSAISEDGVHFEIEDVALESDSLMTDPEVIGFGDEWLMYWAMHEGDDAGVWVTSSTDGVHFDFEARQRIDEIMGIPGAAVIDDEVHLYGCDKGIVYTTSSDGIHFIERDSNPVISWDGMICDPSPTVMTDGSIALVMKGIVEE